MRKLRIHIIIIPFNLLVNNFKNLFWFPKLLIQLNVLALFLCFLLLLCFFLLDLRHLLGECIKCTEVWILNGEDLWLEGFKDIGGLWFGLLGVVGVIELLELFEGFEDLFLFSKLLLIRIHPKLLFRSNILLLLLLHLPLTPLISHHFPLLLLLLLHILHLRPLKTTEIIKAWIYLPLVLLQIS